MKKLLILSLLICTPVMACESYEECMKLANDVLHRDCVIHADTVTGDSCISVATTDTGSPSSTNMMLQIYTRAISFKLDEISKKLDGETK